MPTDASVAPAPDASDTGLGYDAKPYLPSRGGLPSLRRAAAGCRGCPLFRDATQTVFGAGPARARLMLVGEQPGDQEDVKGEPFVGPAGQLLRRALGEAGLGDEDAYFTNVVKHFKFTPAPRGKRSIKILRGPQRAFPQPTGQALRHAPGGPSTGLPRLRGRHAGRRIRRRHRDHVGRRDVPEPVDRPLRSRGSSVRGPATGARLLPPQRTQTARRVCPHPHVYG